MFLICLQTVNKFLMSAHKYLLTTKHFYDVIIHTYMFLLTQKYVNEPYKPLLPVN